jgi:hypothetical protein
MRHVGVFLPTANVFCGVDFHAIFLCFR